jgi:hypothetical protein
MTRAAGWPRGGLGRLVMAALGFALVAPAGLVALPVAGLGLLRRTAGGWRTVVAGIFVGLALAWTLWPGDLPGQTVRATALFATLVFIALAERTRWSVTHRALLAAAVAAAGTVALYLLLGWSWHRLHWWVEYRTGFALRLGLSSLQGALLTPEMTDRVVRWMADVFPALTLVQLVAGLGIATALHGRLAAQPRGRPPGRIREFRFSEHLGWLLVLGIAGLLVGPVDTPLRLVALNLLTVGAALYLARGVAVTAFFWIRAGAVRWLAVAGFLSLVLLAPVTLATLVALGVFDAGLDLRRRFGPPVNE